LLRRIERLLGLMISNRLPVARNRTLTPSRRSLGPVGPPNLYPAFAVLIDDMKAPWVAAHFAVLHERPANIGLEVNLDLFAAVRTRDDELILQSSSSENWLPVIDRRRDRDKRGMAGWLVSSVLRSFDS